MRDSQSAVSASVEDADSLEAAVVEHEEREEEEEEEDEEIEEEVEEELPFVEAAVELA